MSELDSWGYQWLTFDDFAPEVESEFADILSPLDPGQFKGTRVLDAGCGNGRFTRACAALGPRHVVGIDPSHSVFAARANTAALPNATILQGDIPVAMVEGDRDNLLIQGQERTSGGLFQVNSQGQGTIFIQAPVPMGQIDALGITVEPVGGSDGPTTPPVVRGLLYEDYEQS